MLITKYDRVKLFFLVVRLIFKLPITLKNKFKRVFQPIDGTRYIEHCYFLKQLKTLRLSLENVKILDISSPYLFTYILAAQGAIVLKTDINLDESSNFFNDGEVLFRKENAINLSFRDESFDCCYSISVIEHIYKDYDMAVSEMIRVLRTEGLLYLSFPVSGQFKEEWSEKNIYNHQYEKNGKYFFQYIFNGKTVDRIINNHKDKLEVVNISYFTDSSFLNYEKYISWIKYPLKPVAVNYLKNSLLHFLYGIISLKSKSIDTIKSETISTCCLLFRKK